MIWPFQNQETQAKVNQVNQVQAEEPVKAEEPAKTEEPAPTQEIQVEVVIDKDESFSLTATLYMQDTQHLYSLFPFLWQHSAGDIGIRSIA